MPSKPCPRVPVGKSLRQFRDVAAARADGQPLPSREHVELAVLARLRVGERAAGFVGDDVTRVYLARGLGRLPEHLDRRRRQKELAAGLSGQLAELRLA